MIEKIGRNNIFIKILAFILATILWLYVMNEENPPLETSLTVPLETRNLAANLLVIDLPDAIKVRVRGPRSLIAGLLPRDIKPYVDVKDLEEGKHPLNVAVHLPPSLELVEVNPERVTLNLDLSAQKQMAVSLRLTGSTGPNIVVGKTGIDPAQVMVSGAKTFVDAVDRVVATVDMTGKTKEFTTEAPLVFYARDGRQIERLTAKPDRVKVSTVLKQVTDKKVVEVKTLVYGELPAGVTLTRISGEPGKVELQGNPEVLAKIESIYTEPINIGGISKNVKKEVRLQLTREQDKEVIVVPEKITVSIEVGPSTR